MWSLLFMLPFAWQEPETVSPEEIQAQIAKVTESFAESDRNLTQAVDALEEGLLAAAQSAERLVAEMETLLELLPSPPPADPNSSSSSQDSTTPLPEENQATESPAPAPPEGNQGQNPHQEAPLKHFLRDPRQGSWGKLPPRLQQTLDNASAEEVPLRYRRWLVEYHRYRP